MSALRKPAARAEQANRETVPYVPLPHEWIYSVWALQLSACETNVVYNFFSLINLRNAALAAQKREPTGYTRLIDGAAELIETAHARCAERTVTEAIQRLLSGGVIERVNRRDALDRGLITPREAGEPRLAFCYRVCTEKLAELAEAARAEAAAEEAAAQAEAENPAVPEVVHIVGEDHPIVHLPGKQCTVELIPAVRRALGRVARFESEFSATSPLAFAFRIEGDTLRYSVMDAPRRTNSERSRRISANPRDKGLNWNSGGSREANGGNGRGPSVPQSPAPDKTYRQVVGETQEITRRERELCRLFDSFCHQRFGARLSEDPEVLALVVEASGAAPIPFLEREWTERLKRPLKGSSMKVLVPVVEHIRAKWAPAAEKLAEADQEAARIESRKRERALAEARQIVADPHAKQSAKDWAAAVFEQYEVSEVNS